MRHWAVLLAVLALSGFGAKAEGSLIWDYSPAPYGVLQPYWGNESAYQNFAEKVSFNSDVEVTSMDIYSGPAVGNIGDPVTIRLWDDAAGIPGALLTSFTSTISAIDSVGADPSTVRKHADFSIPISLSASTTYWIGMSGAAGTIAQATLASIPPGGDGFVAVFVGTTYNSSPSIGDMAFRLYGEAQMIPEPAAIVIWSLLGTVGIAIGCWRRRRSK